MWTPGVQAPGGTRSPDPGTDEPSGQEQLAWSRPQQRLRAELPLTPPQDKALCAPAPSSLRSTEAQTLAGGQAAVSSGVCSGSRTSRLRPLSPTLAHTHVCQRVALTRASAARAGPPCRPLVPRADL